MSYENYGINEMNTTTIGYLLLKQILFRVYSLGV